jgi:hypothetical protein
MGHDYRHLLGAGALFSRTNVYPDARLECGSAAGSSQPEVLAGSSFVADPGTTRLVLAAQRGPS